MQYDPKKILNNFEGIARSTANEILSNWWEQYDFNLNRLKSILNNLKIDLAQNESWKSDPNKFWSDIRPVVLRMQQWLRSLHLIDDEISLELLAGKFLEKYNESAKDYPAEIRILIGEFYWQTQPEDRPLIRIRKKLQPIKYKLTNSKLKLINLIRNILQKPPRKKASDERIINLQEFLKMFIALPVSAHLRDEWYQFLQSVFGQLFIIQKNLEESFARMLLGSQIDKIIISEDENIFDDLYAMAENLRDIDIALESLNNYEKQFTYRFKNFWQGLSTEFTERWDYAGTFQLPHQKYSSEEFRTQEYKFENKLKRDLQNWQKQLNGMIDEWQKDLDLIQLGLNTNLDVHNTIRIYKKNINEELIPELRSVAHQVNLMTNKLDLIEDTSDLRDLYDSQLVGFARGRFSLLLDTVSAANLPVLIGNEMESVNSLIENVSQQLNIFFYRDTANTPPRSKIRQVTLRDLVRFTAFQKCRSACVSLHEDISKRQEDIFRNISQLGRLIEFQFESAIHLSEEDQIDDTIDEAQIIIRDTLDKAEQLLSLIIQEVDNIFELVIKELPVILKIFSGQLYYLFERENIFTEINLFTRMQKKTTRNIKRKRFFQQSRSLSGKFILLPWKAAKMFVKTYFLNYKPDEPVIAKASLQDNISKFLTETSEKISQLPYIYQKLFLFTPLNTGRFYSARSKEMNLLEQEFNNWTKLNTGMIALVGELGSGKTSILNMAKREIFDVTSILHIDFNTTLNDVQQLSQQLSAKFDYKQTDSLEELKQYILGNENQTICIIENLNFLFPKSVSGLELLEKLLDLMIQTQSNIFWIVTCSLYSWQYLVKTVKIEKYFRQIITLGAFSNGDIKSVILNRHRLSGYDLFFESDNDIVQSKNYKKMPSENHRQQYLKSHYFHKLNDISSGNVTVAMLYWLRSIKEIAVDKVIVNATIDFDNNFLENLTENELFTLATVINYEKISIADHAFLFNQSVEQSNLNLDQMSRYGLLDKRDDFYQIHPFLYRHLVELLKSKNILH